MGHLFNQSTDGDYYKPIKPLVFLIIKIITSNMRAKETKTKIYQLKNPFV